MTALVPSAQHAALATGPRPLPLTSQDSVRGPTPSPSRCPPLYAPPTMTAARPCRLPVTVVVALLLLCTFVTAAATAVTNPLYPVKTLRAVSCPCHISVAVRRDVSDRPHPPLHILVAPAFATSATSFDRRLSRLNCTADRATTSDALFVYHAVTISHRALISVSVSLPGHGRRTVQPHRLHISATRRQAVRCPVILEPHRRRAANPSSSSSSSSSTDPRIVGGRPVSARNDLRSYLAFIAIPSSDGSRACSGTLISEWHVVSAAHCGIDTFSTVFLGGTQGNPSDGMRFGIASVSTHPRFATSNTERRFRYDIAVITLVARAPSSLRHMRVNVNTSVPIDRSVVRAAGYGILRHEGSFSNPSAKLHAVDVPVVPEATCERVYGERNLNVNYDFQVCAGYYGRGGCDSCQGDSGGPLFQYDADDNPVLVGIVSFGVECATASFPGVYVRTSAHNDLLPNESNVSRSNDAVAVFSDYVPTPIVPRETIILAASAAAVLFVIAVCVACVVASRCRKAKHAHPLPAAPGNDVVLRPDSLHAGRPPQYNLPPPIPGGPILTEAEYGAIHQPQQQQQLLYTDSGTPQTTGPSSDPSAVVPTPADIDGVWIPEGSVPQHDHGVAIPDHGASIAVAQQDFHMFDPYERPDGPSAAPVSGAAAGTGTAGPREVGSSTDTAV